MTRNLIGVLLLASVFGVGCAAKSQPNLKPVDPLEKAKKEFLYNYEEWMPKSEREALKRVVTLEEFKAFEAKFWLDRDPSPATPENELKTEVDKRIADIANEVLFRDMGGPYGIPGFTFASNGGRKSDPAKVYVRLGMPPVRIQISEKNYLTDVMLWIYTDEYGNELYRFLFYRRGGFGNLQLLDSYGVSSQCLVPINQYQANLLELSKRHCISAEEFYFLERELMESDPERMFWRALWEFSPLGITPRQALEPPDPAALFAKYLDPSLVGALPELPESKEFKLNSYASFAPVSFFRVYQVAGQNGEASLRFIVLIPYQSLDWELSDDKAMANVTLRVDFWNKTRREAFRWRAGATITLSKTLLDKPNQVVAVIVPAIKDRATGLDLNEFANQILTPGEYLAELEALDQLLEKRSSPLLLEFTK